MDDKDASFTNQPPQPPAFNPVQKDDKNASFANQPPQPPEFNPVHLLVPAKVSVWAIVSFYFGLIGCGLPILGFLFALVGLVAGIIALIQWRQADSYGAVTSNIRAILGVVMSTLGVLVWGVVAVLAFINMK